VARLVRIERRTQLIRGRLEAFLRTNIEVANGWLDWRPYIASGGIPSVAEMDIQSREAVVLAERFEISDCLFAELGH
jgi:hypothetical protein